jgi:hypothetical protein
MVLIIKKYQKEIDISLTWEKKDKTSSKEEICLSILEN